MIFCFLSFVYRKKLVKKDFKAKKNINYSIETGLLLVC